MIFVIGVLIQTVCAFVPVAELNTIVLLGVTVIEPLTDGLIQGPLAVSV